MSISNVAIASAAIKADIVDFRSVVKQCRKKDAETGREHPASMDNIHEKIRDRRVTLKVHASVKINFRSGVDKAVLDTEQLLMQARQYD